MEIETQSYITNLLKTNPKIVENNLNYNDKKFNKKKEYYQLKEHIDTFLEKESDDRFFIMPGLRVLEKQQSYTNYSVICLMKNKFQKTEYYILI